MYFIANDKHIAKANQKDYWEKILGHPKNPEDTTEFLCFVIDHPSNNTGLVVVDDWSYSVLTPKLTPQQKTILDQSLKPRDDPSVEQFFADLEAAQPPMPV